MTFETTAGTPAEHAQPVGGVATGRSESTGPRERTGPGEPTGLGMPTGPGERTAPTPVQIRLQILSTEHWSLLASRGLAWNETFARAGMYLSTLSGSMVALGLIGGIDHFGDAFLTFALVLLPVVEFVGLGTWVRMGVSNYHDAITIYGMNRIRAAYLEIAPELAPYFVMGVHDDPKGIGITMAVPPGTPQISHLLASTPFLIGVLNSVVAGAIGALGLVRFTTVTDAIVVLGAILIAALVLMAQLRYARRRIRDGQTALLPMFPTPSDDGTRAADPAMPAA